MSITPFGVSGVTVFGESVICVLEKESDIVFIFLILSLYEQMLSPITGFEKSLGFYDHTIRKNKVRGIRCQFSVTDLQSLVLKVNPLPFKGEGCILFKLRTELHSTMLDSLLRFLHFLLRYLLLFHQQNLLLLHQIRRTQRCRLHRPHYIQLTL